MRFETCTHSIYIASIRRSGFFTAHSLGRGGQPDLRVPKDGNYNRLSMEGTARECATSA